MSKKFRIAKRISMEDIDHFEDIEVDDDFVDKDMVQIIADNEYDPMYDDCESVAVALQLAGYGKVADLEAKLAESESKVAVGRFWHSAYEGKQLDYDKLNNDYNKQEKLLSEVLADKSKLQFEFDQLKQQLAEKEKEIESLKVDCVLNEELEEKDYTIVKPFLKETLTIEEIKHIIKKLSDFNLRQTSFHDIQKNDVIFNAYINKHIAYKKCLDLLDLVGQDKISFAVEQLEKVKEFFLKEERDEEMDTDYVITKENWEIADFLLDQIKQLKEIK